MGGLTRVKNELESAMICGELAFPADERIARRGGGKLKLGTPQVQGCCVARQNQRSCVPTGSPSTGTAQVHINQQL